MLLATLWQATFYCCCCRQSEFNKAAAVVYKEFLDKAESFAPPCHGCPLCDRAFQDNYAFTQFKEKVGW